MVLRPLGSTGIQVSPLGLGTVKFGRNEQVKYPSSFEIPDDNAVRDLLALSHELGINLIDTAPAYGNSEQRLGRLLPGLRDEWVIVTKVGETFEKGHSSFDFSARATRESIEQSLRSLRTDYLDVVLIHSHGGDLEILRQEDVLETLRDLQRRGLVRAIGMSSKTVEGGLLVVQECDLVMATCNPDYNDELPVLEAAAKANKGVLVKKGLMSGHVKGAEGVSRSMAFIFSQPGVSSMIAGTINPAHLRSNVAALEAVLGET
ncbi:MAG: aldo/keto reductase [Gammaproteobacteria bacterium (ex Lamellibrachia satsuma)]|nr:MAG: aldo/keto reductase [Gammaproteobacteria bacterium (ex Lamellibrachia satsuma)]RRS33982.1 MAG: aldo/keto reductase [Gammaproteobacteria bacterium (ex Lamellibrachia satsuma)]RRS35582.1 MAG: aldo/keto reductase [Gammaproteobacteria bacterium (ex Lamellibrachia satsuma)]